MEIKHLQSLIKRGADTIAQQESEIRWIKERAKAAPKQKDPSTAFSVTQSEWYAAYWKDKTKLKQLVELQCALKEELAYCVVRNAQQHGILQLRKAAGDEAVGVELA